MRRRFFVKGIVSRSLTVVKAIKTILIALSAVLIWPAMTAQAAVGAFTVHYSMFFVNQGWSVEAADNAILYRATTYPSAMNMYLTGQPAMSGTVQYEIYQNGGWSGLAENCTIVGGVDAGHPIEAIRVRFNGELESSYDIYYRIYQNGAWGDWTSNFAVAGTIGKGTYIQGMQATVVNKGEEPKTTNVDPAKPMVALTFDDGPSAVNTPRILTALEAAGGHATFFVVGTNVSKNADVLRRMVADGNEIGNHTWNHNYLHKATSEQIATYINQTADAVQAACGVRPVAVRPPGGGINQTAQNTLAALGSPAILWDIDTLDWKHRNTQKTISAVLDHVSDGDIVLMHDIHSPTADAAEVIIPELVARGYQLVTVTEMASMRGGYVPGQKYFSFKSK